VTSLHIHLCISEEEKLLQMSWRYEFRLRHENEALLGDDIGQCGGSLENLGGIDR